MSPELLVGIIVGGLVLLAIITIATKKAPKKLNHEKYQSKWQELQTLCADKATWGLAVIDADKLLDDALKRRHFKGKTMGERMVSAQRTFSDNDSVWFGHKLRNKLVHEQDVRLRQDEVLDALKGIRQGLKDLGAL